MKLQQQNNSICRFIIFGILLLSFVVLKFQVSQFSLAVTQSSQYQIYKTGKHFGKAHSSQHSSNFSEFLQEGKELKEDPNDQIDAYCLTIIASVYSDRGFNLEDQKQIQKQFWAHPHLKLPLFLLFHNWKIPSHSYLI